MISKGLILHPVEWRHKQSLLLYDVIDVMGHFNVQRIFRWFQSLWTELLYIIKELTVLFAKAGNTYCFCPMGLQTIPYPFLRIEIENNALTKSMSMHHVLEMMQICSSKDMASGIVNEIDAPKLGLWKDL